MSEEQAKAPPQNKRGGFKCTKILLEGGTSETDRKFLNIAPTMRSITYEGRRYFRCPRSAGQDPEDGQWGMMYLWDGWVDWKMKQRGIKT